jgi:Ca-activated chloride channel family protein
VILLFDNSLSMQWEKLERSYAAIGSSAPQAAACRSLQLDFVQSGSVQFQAATGGCGCGGRAAGLDFVRSSKLRGGTDIGKALSGWD